MLQKEKIKKKKNKTTNQNFSPWEKRMKKLTNFEKINKKERENNTKRTNTAMQKPILIVENDFF